VLNVTDDSIYNMLFEREDVGKGAKDDLPDIKYKVVASFPGRPHKELRLADPRAVFKELGITKSFPGETIIHSIKSLLDRAKNHSVINQSYGKVDTVDDDGKKGVVVDLKGLDAKNGARYMRILLIYAFKLGALRNGTDLRVQDVGNRLVIYPSRQGRENRKKQPRI